MILFYLLVLVMCIPNHPIWSRFVGELTIIKYLGLLCGSYAIFHVAVRGTSRQFLKSAVTRLNFLLIGFALTSYSVFSSGDWGSKSPAFSYLSFLLLFFITIAVVDSERRLHWTLLAMIGSVAFASLYVIREWQLYRDVYVGFRPGWIVLDPNYFSVSALIGLAVGFCLARSPISKIEKVFIVGSSAITIFALIVSASRGAFVGLFAASLFFVIKLRHRVRNLVILLVLLASVSLVPVGPLARLMSPTHSDNEAAQARIAAWSAGVRMIQTHPWIGVGLGNFKQSMPAFKVEDSDTDHIAHNVYIEMAAELGIGGAILFIALLLATYRALSRIIAVARTEDNQYLYYACLGMQGALVAYATAACFVSVQYQKIFWLLVALSVTTARIASQANESRTHVSDETDQLEEKATSVATAKAGTAIAFVLLAVLMPARASAEILQNSEKPVSRDSYGGVIVPGVTQQRTSHYSLQKIGKRWVFVTPEGNPSFFLGVSLVTATWPTGTDQTRKGYREYVKEKYAPGNGPRDGFLDPLDRWAYYTRDRLRSWGFNAVSTFSYYPAVPNYSPTERLPGFGNLKPNLLPHVVTARSGGDAMKQGKVKNLYALHTTKFWNPYFPDVFDPAFEVSLRASAATVPKSPSIVFLFVDQTDEMRGVELTHPHLGFVTAAAPLVVSHDDHAFGGPKDYSDTKLYSKYALRDFLRVKYSTIGALNTAWGTTYSTWDSAGGWGDGQGFLDENGSQLGEWTTASPEKAGYPAVRRDLDAFAAQLMRRWYQAVYFAYKARHPQLLLCSNNMTRPKPYVYEGMLSANGAETFVDLVGVSDDPDAGEAYLRLKRPFLGPLPFSTAENDSPLKVTGVVKKIESTGLGNQLRYVTIEEAGFWWAGSNAYKGRLPVLVQFSSLPDKLNKNGKLFPQYYRIVNWISQDTVAIASYGWHTGTIDELAAALKPGDKFRRVVSFHPEFELKTQESRGEYYSRQLQRMFQASASNGEHFYVGANFWSLSDTGWTDYFESYNFGLVTLRDNAYDGKQAKMKSGFDEHGFRTGGEDADYGDFISAVTAANKRIARELSDELKH